MKKPVLILLTTLFIEERKEKESRGASPAMKKDAPEARYNKGESLLCYDGPTLYEVF